MTVWKTGGKIRRQRDWSIDDFDAMKIQRSSSAPGSAHKCHNTRLYTTFTLQLYHTLATIAVISGWKASQAPVYSERKYMYKSSSGYKTSGRLRWSSWPQSNEPALNVAHITPTTCQQTHTAPYLDGIVQASWQVSLLVDLGLKAPQDHFWADLLLGLEKMVLLTSLVSAKILEWHKTKPSVTESDRCQRFHKALCTVFRAVFVLCRLGWINHS